MNVSAPFIKRPVGTSLLTLALAISGCLGYLFLPVSPLPQVDFPTIQVSAGLPGASPETMASAVATPLERQFGRIAGVTQMTSTNTLGSSNVVLQFDLNRDNLIFKAFRGSGSSSALVTLKREVILLVAGDSKLFGDDLGFIAHVYILEDTP